MMFNNPRDDNNFCIPIFIYRKDNESYSKLDI